jgi:ATPase subunit of ABC transporter with duplicated ATPase domains
MSTDTGKEAVPPQESLIIVDELALVSPDDGSTQHISLRIDAGLTMVRASDERLTQQLFSALLSRTRVEAQAERQIAKSTYREPLPGDSEKSMTGQDWLALRRQQFVAWDAALESDLIEAFDLDIHIEKPLYMFSRGTVRKMILMGAFASSADVALLETPYAALDAPSCELLTELLTEAAGHQHRAWVVADFEVPEPLRDLAFNTLIDCGA